jgi:hypothetical protein
MIRLTTLRFIGLRWVSHLIFNFIFSSKCNSLVLHPCHKLHYFKKAGWEDDWIDTTRDIVCTEFDQTYAFMDIDVPETETHSAVVSSFYLPCCPSLTCLMISPHRLHPRTSLTICQHFSPLLNLTFVTS